MSYIFDLTIKDNLWRETIVFTTLFSIFLVVTNIIGKAFEVKNNWSRMRCRPEVMQYAWLYGKNTNDVMEYCLENAGNQVKRRSVVDPAMFVINSGYRSMNDKADKINNDLTTLDSVVKKTDVAAGNKEKALAIYKNVLALKEGIQKVIAGLVIQNNLSNGVLKTTSATRILNDALTTNISVNGINVVGNTKAI